MTNFDAVILSAGLGERLRPITYSIPKVLLPILGETCFEKIHSKIEELNPTQVLVNLHYMGNVIREHLCSSGNKLTFVEEREILGTGGALVNMSSLFRSNVILVHNGDVYCETDLREIIEFFLRTESDITLAVSRNVPKRNLVVSDERFTGLDEHTGLTGFAGIAVYKKDVFEKFTVEFLDAKTIWLDALNRGLKVSVYDIGDVFWSDIGTPEGYASTVFYLLKKRGENLFQNLRKPEFPDIKFDGFLIMEGECRIEGRAFFRNAIILPGSSLRVGRYENMILSPSGELSFDEVLAMGGHGNKYSIGHGGSDRKFFRVLQGRKRIILCDYGDDVENFNKHLKASEFLRFCGVPVPEILDVDVLRNLIWMEDFGDITLYTFLKYPPNQKNAPDYYRKAARILAQLHSLGPTISLSKDFGSFVFDVEYFRWEQAHFINNFVLPYGRLEVPEEVMEELDSIAVECSKFPHVVLHRDFQSQNLMVRQNGELGVTDFIGLRWGPRSYDLASLLFDPYTDVSSKIREDAINSYILNCSELSGIDLSSEDLYKELNFTRIQRHMQALGAYGYLSRVKGKKYFEKFIPSGLSLLVSDVAVFSDRFPAFFCFLRRLFELLLDTDKHFEYN